MSHFTCYPSTVNRAPFNIDRVRASPSCAGKVAGTAGGALIGVLVGLGRHTEATLVACSVAGGATSGLVLGTGVDFVSQFFRDAALRTKAQKQNFFPVTLRESELAELNRAGMALAIKHKFQYTPPQAGDSGGSVPIWERGKRTEFLHFWTHSGRTEKREPGCTSSSIPEMAFSIGPGEVVICSDVKRNILYKLIVEAGEAAAPLRDLLFTGNNAIPAQASASSFWRRRGTLTDKEANPSHWNFT